MDNLLKLQIHQLVQDFLHRINQNDSYDLLKYNQVTDVMLAELYEALNNYFSTFQLSIIPFDELPEIMPQNIPLFNIEVMDNNDFILECNIYNFGKMTDLLLQASIEYKESKLMLFDPLFKS